MVFLKPTILALFKKEGKTFSKPDLVEKVVEIINIGNYSHEILTLNFDKGRYFIIPAKSHLSVYVIYMIKAESKTSEAIPQRKLDCNVLQLVKYLDAEIIDIENEYSAYKKETFFNMNRPEDFDFVRIKLFESLLDS